jgi:2-haloacid dehalogenase
MSELSTMGVKAVVFDVNGTLSDMSPMAQAFESVGAPPALARTWFAGVLRDGFALSTVGESKRFVDVARTHLMAVLASVTLHGSPEQATSSILDRLTTLSLHPDVAEGVRSLARAHLQVVTLSNGSPDIARRLLSDAGLLEEFSHILSVESHSPWKPAEAAYSLASSATGFAPDELLLAAVHPWDIHGAHHAGMHTAWINRDNETYPTYFTPPDLSAPSIIELANALGSPRL